MYCNESKIHQAITFTINSESYKEFFHDSSVIYVQLR